jgi:hypothetical protein
LPKSPRVSQKRRRDFPKSRDGRRFLLEGDSNRPEFCRRIPEFLDKIREFLSKIPEFSRWIPEFRLRIPESLNKIPEFLAKIAEFFPGISEFSNRIPEFFHRIPGFLPRIPEFSPEFREFLPCSGEGFSRSGQFFPSIPRSTLIFLGKTNQSPKLWQHPTTLKATMAACRVTSRRCSCGGDRDGLSRITNECAISHLPHSATCTRSNI